MPEEIKTPAADIKTAPVVPEAAKATPVKAEVVEQKTTPTETKPEAKAEEKVETPAEELKTLLDEAGVEKEEVKEAVSVPEKYEFKLPEGMTLDEAAMAIVSPVFKELGLDNAQAQKLVDLQNSLSKASEEAHVANFSKYVEDLKTESKTFFGTKLPEVMRNVARTRDTLFHKELIEKLNISGLANDKDVLIMMDKAGRLFGEGKFVEGQRSAPARGDGSTKVEGTTLADVYPSMVTK